MKILHIISEEELEKFKKERVYHPKTFEKDGFIKFSCFNQVTRVANSVYFGRRDLKLLLIGMNDEVKEKVVFEDLNDLDEKYPHLYSNLKIDQVDSIEDLKIENDEFRIKETVIYSCTETKYTLKNGGVIYIRHAVESDAAIYIDYLRIVACESDNLILGKGDVKTPEEIEKTYIKNLLKSKGNYRFCGFIDGKLVASINIFRPERRRVSHKSSFCISVLKEFWGNGIGDVMVKHMIDFLKVRGNTKKINLQVREDNISAVNMYKKNGFSVEGKEIMAMIINGESINLLNMGLSI